MTSSQEPQLTRREIRERERLIEQQQAAAASQQTDAAAPAQPPSSPPPGQTAQQPYPQQRAPQPSAPQPRPADPRQAPQSPGRPSQGWSDGAARGPQAAPPQQQYPQSAPPPRSRDAYTSGSIPAPQGDPRTTGPQRPPQGGAPRPPQGPPRSAPAQQSTPERTLTRRELRAMLESHSGDGFDEVDEFDQAPQRHAPAPQRGPGPQQRPPQGGPEGRGPGPQPVPRHPHQPAPGRAAAPHTTVDAGLDEPVVAPKPVGHWTSQLNLPDERVEPYDQLLSRGGSPRGVPTTTNALILPSLPDQGALGTPLAPSGEIIVTGSIDLPRSYGSTGVHPSQIDSSDVDRIFDGNVEDVAGPGVAPVAATRAISTQGPSKTMMAPPSKEGMNVPLVLAVTAGVLALGVVATLVVGAVAGLF
jgi:hypothetical protein